MVARVDIAYRTPRSPATPNVIDAEAVVCQEEPSVTQCALADGSAPGHAW